MKHVKRFLTFIRLMDAHDGLISLTSVALWVVIAKIALTSDTSLIDLGALLVALMNYSAKKVINGKTSQGDVDLSVITARVEEIAGKVSAQQLAMGFKEVRR